VMMLTGAVGLVRGMPRAARPRRVPGPVQPSNRR
jgi:hypothetical protein